jgi:hypothetical protein
MDDQPRTLTINGAQYVRSDADYQYQIDKVCDMLGQPMLEALVEAEAMVAGGSILSAFTHQDINDIDVYFPSKEAMAKAFLAVTEGWESVYLGHTDKSITLKDRDTEATVQFIYFDYFKTPEQIFEAFDFTVCMAAIELSTFSFVAHQSFISDMASRTLHFNRGTRFPYISLVRTKKYQERGYKIGKGSLLAIANACAGMPINSWDDARNQLGGVYGYEIDLKIEENTEFTQEALHNVLTEIKEDRPMIVHNDYDEICSILKQELASKLEEKLEELEG